MPSDDVNAGHDPPGWDPGIVRAWILGIVMAVVGLIGLGIASRAEDDAFYYTGLGLFVLGVLFVYGLIHRYVGR